MPDEGIVTRLVARIKALLPADWLGRAGEEFRDGTQAISEFAEKNRLLPEDILHDGVDLGRRKIEGLATHEHAGAQKNYAEAEKTFQETEEKKIDIELKKRSFEMDISQKEANVAKTHEETRKLRAEADLAELIALKALIELQKTLADAGVAIHRDERGNFTVMPAVTTKFLPVSDQERADGHSA
jgi:hypothetical protein